MMSEIDFKQWNKLIRTLTYKHNTFNVFKDYLDIIIDQWTIPDQETLYKTPEKYTEKDYHVFMKLFKEHLHIMREELEKKDYYDFLGEWWESDQNLTNKDTEQYFTPHDVTLLMCELLNLEEMGDKIGTMHDCCCGSGRFALAYHKYRPNDWFFLVDVDEVAIKMTLINMVLHGMRGVVCWGNALTRKCFQCWVVSPSLLEYGGLPYIVPMGENIGEALAYLPMDSITEAPTNSNVEEINTVDNDKKIGGLDAWL
jgi:type I restriction enzyme M protein